MSTPDLVITIASLVGLNKESRMLGVRTRSYITLLNPSPDSVFLCLVGFGPFGEHAVNASWVAVQVRCCCCLFVFSMNVSSPNAAAHLEQIVYWS